jgi:hypothetical protein
VGWLFFAHRVSPHIIGGLVTWLCDGWGLTHDIRSHTTNTHRQQKQKSV